MAMNLISTFGFCVSDLAPVRNLERESEAQSDSTKMKAKRHKATVSPCAPFIPCPCSTGHNHRLISTGGKHYAKQVPCGAANLYCPRGSAAPVFVDRGFYTVGGYQFDSGQRSTLEKGFFYDAVVVHDDFNPLTTTTTNSNDINNNGNKEVSGKTMVMPDLPRGASFRSDVVVCPEGWYCTGDGSGSKCPPGTYGSKVRF